MGTGALIAAGLVVLLLAAGGGEQQQGNGNGNGNGGQRQPVGPIPTPTTDDDVQLVKRTICDCAKRLGAQANQMTISACVLGELHPDVPWPAIPDYDDSTVQAVEQYVVDQVGAFLASPSAEAFCNEADTLVEILEELVAPAGSPTPGKFYQIRQGDNLATIARQALNATVPGMGDDGADGKGGQRRLDYIYCITSSPNWNMPLYASPSFSNTFPSFYGVNGMGLRRAFFPWHENAVKSALQGNMPRRAITQDGSRITGRGSDYGLLWLPPVNPAALSQFSQVTCAHVDWSDGSSSIDPPPELLARLS